MQAQLSSSQRNSIGTRFLCLAAGLGLLSIAATSFSADQYALLVGINDYPGEDNDLAGCVNDVNAVKNMLTSKFGFKESNIKVLFDTSAATNAVGQAFKSHLVDQAKQGDSVFFYYSGHGTQVPDLDGDEEDDRDEIICTHDLNPQNPKTWATDDFIRHYLSQLKTNRALVMMDCCHSGTGTRTFGTRKIDGARYMHIGFDRPDRARRNFAISKAMRNPATNMNHVLMAACSSSEVAREADFNGKRSGVFTTYLLEEINQGGTGMKLSDLKAKILPRVEAFIADSSSPHDPQTPQFEGNIDQSMSALLGGSPSGPGTQPPPPNPVTPGPNTTNATSSGDIKVTLSTDKATYLEDDRMIATVSIAQDAYLRLYYVDTASKIYMIFPNKFQQDNLVKGGAPVQVPGPGAKFAFRMTEPFGREILKAVVSEEQFADADKDRWGDFNFITFGNLSFKDMSTRGINVEAAPKIGEATVIYEVKPKN